MIKLYALKCSSGYIRNKGHEGCQCVPFNKASVFNEPGELESLVKVAEKEGIKDVKRVELVITEKDYSPVKW